MVLSEEIPEDWHAYLDVLVEGFIQAFTDKYAAAKTLQNVPHIVHHARMTAALGPLCQCWCFRFEEKHQYFKAMISQLKKSRSITLPVAAEL
ncbi:MAG: hypothetical protein O7D30_08110 [Rickettsia endosymbiont of Ixodes persulcatus]|nr:hypothetical protein [Rickettsia endosymbiont of Ixodes persulcatus]